MAILTNPSAPFDVRARFRLRPAHILLLASLANLVPIWAVTYPPLQDYPDHLARAYLLSHWDSLQHQIPSGYSWQFAPYPNLLTDAMLAAFSNAAGIYLAGRIVLSAYVVALPWSVWLLYRQFAPPSFIPAVSCFFVFNLFFMGGFLNFSFSVCLCFLTIALWVRWRDQLNFLRVVALLLLVQTAYFSHIHGFTVLLLSLLTFEVVPPLRGSRLAALLLICAPAALTALVWLRFARATASDFSLPIRFSWMQKASSAAFPVRSGLDRIAGTGSIADIIALVCLISFVVTALRWPIVTRARLAAIWLVLLALFLSLPARILGGAEPASRMTLFLAMFSLVALNLRPRAPRFWLALLAAVFIFRVAWITFEWRQADTVARARIAALSDIPSGARLCSLLYGATSLPGRVQPELHVADYALIERHAFVANLFSDPRQHILRIDNSKRFAAPSTLAADVAIPLLERNCDFLTVIGKSPAEGAVLQQWGVSISKSDVIEVYRRRQDVSLKK